MYNEGDEIVCVQHLHKQWHVTCNDLSEARDARRRVHLAKLGQEMRDEIIQQAAKQVEDPADKYYHGKQGALIKQSTGLEGLDLGFRDRKAREAKAKAATAKNSTASAKMSADAKSTTAKSMGSAGIDTKAKTMSGTGRSTKSSSAASGGAKAAA